MTTTDKFDIYFEGEFVQTLTGLEIQTMYMLDVNELNWAIEENGLCEVINDNGREVTILEHGDTLFANIDDEPGVN